MSRHVITVALCLALASALARGDVPGREAMGELSANTTNLLQRIATLEQRFRTDEPYLALESDYEHLHRGLVAMMRELFTGPGGAYDASRYRDYPISQTEIEQCVARLEQGEDCLGCKRGVFTGAFYSTADGSGQPITIYLPKDFDRKETWPLQITLYFGLDDPHKKREYDRPYITVCTTARSVMAFLGTVEHDVLSIRDSMVRHFRADPRRVFLSGYSAGANSTMAIVSRHPDKFAGAIPFVAFGNSCILNNLRHVGVWCHHGLEDWTSAIGNVRVYFQILRSKGYPAILKEYPDAGHSIRRPVDTTAWLLPHRVPEQPAEVIYECETPANSKAYWADVQQFENVNRHAFIRARVHDDGHLQRLILHTENAAEMALDMVRAPVDRSRDLLLQADSLLTDMPSPLPATVVLAKTNGTWSVSSSPLRRAATGPRPYIPGAAANLFSGEPMLIVYGTHDVDAANNEALARAADRLALCGGSPYAMKTGGFPVKADVDVTADDIRNYNLLLVGGGSANALTRSMLPKLPLRIDPDNRLRVGERDVPLGSSVLSLFHYNPLATDRFVYLVAPFGSAPQLKPWVEEIVYFLPGANGWFRADQPDLCVQSFGRVQRAHLQFDRDWQWRGLPGAGKPMPEAFADRDRLAQIHVEIMHRRTACDFALWWGPEDEKLFGWDFNPLQSYDTSTFTEADFLVRFHPVGTMTGEVSGEELAEIRERFIESRKMVSHPPMTSNAIEPHRTYTLVLPYELIVKLGQRRKTLSNVANGPEITVHEQARRIFK